jgi:tetratricopeptide (TPR) repeat protein
VRASDVWRLVPFFAAGIAMGVVTIWLERHHVGAQGIDWQLSPAERVLIAGRALWFYAGKLIWPTNLAFMYPRWEVDVTDPAQLVYPLAVLALVAGLWLARARVGTAPVLAVLLFAGTLFPALGFFDVFPMRYTFVADHYQYLASIPLIALAAGAGARLARANARGLAVAATAGGALLVLVLAALTWRQSHAYATHEALWQDTLVKVPESWMGHVSLGALLERRGLVAEAEWHYRESVRYKPDFGIAHVNLGALLANQGRLEEAVPHFREAVRLEPDMIDSYLSLGRALLYVNRADEAADWFRAALERWPDDARARALLDQALAAARRPLVSAPRQEGPIP